MYKEPKWIDQSGKVLDPQPTVDEIKSWGGEPRLSDYENTIKKIAVSAAVVAALGIKATMEKEEQEKEPNEETHKGDDDALPELQ